MADRRIGGCTKGPLKSTLGPTFVRQWLNPKLPPHTLVQRDSSPDRTILPSFLLEVSAQRKFDPLTIPSLDALPRPRLSHGALTRTSKAYFESMVMTEIHFLSHRCRQNTYTDRPELQGPILRVWRSSSYQPRRSSNTSDRIWSNCCRLPCSRRGKVFRVRILEKEISRNGWQRRGGHSTSNPHILGLSECRRVSTPRQH